MDGVFQPKHLFRRVGKIKVCFTFQVIQRRDDFGENQRENFSRGWDEYKYGFGNPEKVFKKLLQSSNKLLKFCTFMF